MTPSEYLLAHGWRRIGERRFSTGRISAILWDHPRHQMPVRGYFFTVTAMKHQVDSKSKGCDCYDSNAEQER